MGARNPTTKVPDRISFADRNVPCASGRAACRSLERVIGPDPKGSGAASGRGMDVAASRNTYVAFLQQLDGQNRLDVDFYRIPRAPFAPLTWTRNQFRPPPGDVSRATGVSEAPARTVVVGSVIHSVAHRNGTPPARGTQSQGLRHAETARLPNWASFRFSVPSRTYPQGGVPCRTEIRTNVIPRKGPSS
jgi:hypothetical protein